MTHIIRAPLQQRHRHGGLQRRAHRGYIAIKQLILQSLGAGGNNHLATRQQRRRQISKRLARARACLGHDNCLILNGFLDSQRHGHLAFASAEFGYYGGKCALRGENIFEFGHAREFSARRAG